MSDAQRNRLDLHPAAVRAWFMVADRTIDPAARMPAYAARDLVAEEADTDAAGAARLLLHVMLDRLLERRPFAGESTMFNDLYDGEFDDALNTHSITSEVYQTREGWAAYLDDVMFGIERLIELANEPGSNIWRGR